jgi:hypothetical protein
MRMRLTSIVVAVFLFLSVGGASGQESIQYGLRAGLSVATLDSDFELFDPDSRTAFTGGGFVVFDLSGLWAIQAEVLYVPKGATSKQMGTDENGESTGEFTSNYNVNYVEVPILAKISLGESPLHLLLGPALAFKTSAKTGGDVPGGGKVDEDWEGIAGTDLGLVFGLDAAFPASFGDVILDARYTLGTSNVWDNSDTTMKNKAFLFTVGVGF